MRVKVTSSRSVPSAVRDFVSRAVRNVGSTVSVQRRELPYWQERGWTRNGNTYTGAYQTRYSVFSGEIRQHSATDIDFFLFEPSDEIRACSHWPCFQHRGNGWYLVHMGRRPRDVSSGIMAIERLITDAYRG